MRIRKATTALLAGCFMAAPAATADEFPAVEPPKPEPPPVAPGSPFGNKLFYLPTRDEPDNPGNWGYKYQQKEIVSKDGTKLHSWWIESKQQPAKGTVVFSHGNAGSMGHHLGFVMWMAKSGYDILIYDYRGYGKSQGKTERTGMIQDVRAALEFAGNRPESKGKPVVSYGFSLGGAKSVSAIASGKTPNLKVVVTESAFASYREMAEIMGGRLAARVVTNELSPVDQIAKLSPLPLLIIHGTHDPVVPIEQGKKLFEAAKGPKTLFEVKEGGHGNCLVLDKAAYRRRMATWLDEQLKP